MIRLRVEERLALSTQTRLHELESAQLGIVSNVGGKLHQDKNTRNDERAPHAVD
jgi:hypothetical protein